MILKLPDEMLCGIADYLPLDQLLRFGVSCKNFKDVTTIYLRVTQSVSRRRI